MMFVGLIHMATPSFGGYSLGPMSSVCPGTDTAPIVGWDAYCLAHRTGFVGGGIFGLLFGIYRFRRRQQGSLGVRLEPAASAVITMAAPSQRESAYCFLSLESPFRTEFSGGERKAGSQ
jgi:hypothetical protein